MKWIARVFGILTATAAALIALLAISAFWHGAIGSGVIVMLHAAVLAGCAALQWEVAHQEARR